jgi:hypothetical protein
MTLATFSKHVARTGLTIAMMGALSTPFFVYAQSKDVTNSNSNDKGTAAAPGTKVPAGSSNTSQPASQPVVTAPAGTAGTPVVAPTAAQSSNGDNAFKPLTQLPGIQQAASSDTLPQFLNQLYKICIGLGATFAFIMIMYAGFQIMTSQGSVASNEKAKTHIREALFGLLLILAPTIVFTIINPDILKLNINVDGLKSSTFNENYSGGAGAVAGGFVGADAYLWENAGDSSKDAARCAIEKGVISYECRKKDESGGRAVGVGDTCNSNENKYNVCKASGSAEVNTGASCSAKYNPIQTYTIDANHYACDLSKGYAAIPHGCCTNSATAGTLCCGKPI